MGRGLTTVLIAVLVVTTAAAAWPAPNSIVLQLKGEPGSEAKYQTSLAMEMDMRVQTGEDPNQTLTINPRLEAEAVTIERVASVADNGDLSMSSQVESFDINLVCANLHLSFGISGPGGPGPQLIRLPALPFRAVMSKRGKLLAIEGLEKLAAPMPGPAGEKLEIGKLISDLISKMGQPLYPEGPVAVGQSWEWEMTIDPAAIMTALGLPIPEEAKQQLAALKFPIRSTSTLVGFETVGGIECAKIEALSPWQLNMPMPGPQGSSTTLSESGSTKVTTWFDYAAGRKVKEATEVSMDMAVVAGSATPAKMTMRLTGNTQLANLGR